MSVKLVFIGRLEDLAGGPERQVSIASTIDALLASLEPELADALRGERVRIAVNGAVVADRGNATLKDGDEIAFLPPVSGG